VRGSGRIGFASGSLAFVLRLYGRFARLIMLGFEAAWVLLAALGTVRECSGAAGK